MSILAVAPADAESGPVSPDPTMRYLLSLIKPLATNDLRGRVAGLAVALSLFQLLPATAQTRLPEILPLTQPEGEVEPWSLDELEIWAERNSPDLRRAAAEVQVQRGKAWQAGLYPNPILEGGSNQLAGRDSQYFAMLSQEIVTRHKLQLEQAAACREVWQAELQFLRTRFDLLTNVRQSFYTTLAAQRRLDALHELMRVAKRAFDAAESLEKSGAGSRADTILLELELERADFALQNAAASLQAAQRQLAATLGDPDLVIERLSGDLAEGLPDYPYQLTQSGVLSRNALVQAAQIEVERNQLLLRRAEVEPHPNVTVTAGMMQQVLDPHEMAIIQFSLPLPLWNKNQGNIQAAQAGVSKAAHNSRKTRVDLLKQLAMATGRFDVARQQVAKYEQRILPLARESVKINQQGFDQGQFDLLRVLQSQRALVDSELNYLNAQEIRWNAAAEISGLLQEEAFPPPVSDE